AQMMTHCRGHRLEAWMTAVLHDDLRELHSFVTGRRRDQDAVTVGLALPCSSGPVEGHVNRIRRSRDRCTAAPTPTCSANASAGRLSMITESRVRRFAPYVGRWGRCPARLRKPTAVTAAEPDRTSSPATGSASSATAAV